MARAPKRGFVKPIETPDDDKADAVKIRGTEYEAMPFTDYHLDRIGRCITVEGRNYGLGSFDELSEAAQVLKNVILPDLPVEIVYKSKSGDYVWMLDQMEILQVLLNVVRLFHVRQLREARAKGNSKAIAFFGERVEEFTSLLKGVPPKSSMEILVDYAEAQQEEEQEAGTDQPEADEASETQSSDQPE